MGNYINNNAYGELESTSKHLIFSVNGCVCAINVALVCKIAELSNISPLQQTEPYILGLTEADGEVYPVADLRIFFGADKKSLPASKHAVLLANEKSKVYVVVDEVISIIDIKVKPSACLFNKNPCISGIIKTDDRNIILLSNENLLSLLKV